jgi:thiol-disulfide isomerase/thioredoxin
MKPVAMRTRHDWQTTHFRVPCMALLLVALLGACSPKSRWDAREAEAAWTNVLAATKKTLLPAGWKDRPPSPDEIASFRAQHAQRMLDGAKVARDFQARFPGHSNAPIALQKEYEVLNYAAGLGRTEAFARLNELEGLLLKDPTLPANERYTLQLTTLQRRAVARQAEGSAVVLGELEKGARELLKEFPDRAELWSMLTVVAQGADTKKSRALCQEILASAAAPQAAKVAAQQLLERLAFEGQPFDLKFTAFDGREIATSTLRGKVLLIDFWATWCGPCITELPSVKAAYTKYQPQGFEIIGLSFDQSREQLEALLKKEGITWPQYFDGKGWDSELAERYKISGIPTMWLVDKRGIIRDVNARADLETKIERLLKE